MMHSIRPTTLPPLCVVRREVTEHFAAVEQAVCDHRVSRAADRSLDQALSQRLADLRRRLQATSQVGTTPTGSPAVPVASRTPQERLRFLSQFRRDLAHAPGNVARFDPSHRRPRLRLFSPTSPV
jgi:hypothetical protein